MRFARFVVTALSIVALGAWSASAQSDITSPGDAITLVNGANDGDGNSGPPPANEGVERAIDNVTQKYLNFLDLGSGFVVTPSVGSTVVTGARFYSANDAIERDPTSYLLEGSTDGLNFSIISEGALALPEGRNAGGTTPEFTIDPLTMFLQEVSFDNDAAYTSYRVTFPTLRDAAAANSMQIAEVELLGVVPEPSSVALVGLGLAALVVGRRYRKR
jgi:hypothetical protein